MKTVRKTNHVIYACEWDDVDDERIRRWPSQIGEKRPISVKINSWVGISIGAKHVYAEVKEDDQAYWSESKAAWVYVSRDSEKSGYSMRAEVMTEKEAIAIAKTFVDLIAGKDLRNHEVQWDGPGKPKRM